MVTGGVLLVGKVAAEEGRRIKLLGGLVVWRGHGETKNGRGGLNFLGVVGGDRAEHGES